MRGKRGDHLPKSTKEGIQKALYELLRTKTLDEITVTELVEQCGISRQAFYYHFSDLYAVVDWTLQEKLEALNQIPGSQWWAMMNQIMEELYVNRVVVLNAYRAYERSYVEYHLRQWTRMPIQVRVAEAARHHRVTQEQQDFVTELCSQGLVNLILNWFDRGMRSPFTDRLDDLYAILDGSLDYMLDRLSQPRHHFDNPEKV